MCIPNIRDKAIIAMKHINNFHILTHLDRENVMSFF